MGHPGRWRWLVATTLSVALLAAALLAPADSRPAKHVAIAASLPGLTQCDQTNHDDGTLVYAAGGDGVPSGADLSNDDKRYPEQLVVDHLQKAPGPWCIANLSQDKTTTESFVSGGQQAKIGDFRPRLITLTLGRWNDTIKEHVTSCLTDIKNHDFIEANTCALAALLDTSAWDKLQKDLDEIINRFQVMMDGNPQLVVAVTGYFNPYPAATDVATKIPGFCADLVDTIPTCIARWILLPPALVTLDQVVKKLNDKTKEVVDKFTQSTQGRIVFVNPYDPFKDHCTKMQVDIKTTVYHPTNEPDTHNASKDFGCSSPWIKSDGNSGFKPPFLYLTPAVDGVLILATQTTSDMGINPDENGNKCISNLVWNAVKQKLGVPEAPVDSPCDGI